MSSPFDATCPKVATSYGAPYLHGDPSAGIVHSRAVDTRWPRTFTLSWARVPIVIWKEIVRFAKENRGVVQWLKNNEAPAISVVILDRPRQTGRGPGWVSCVVTLRELLTTG